jgi:hypothetical protein
MSFGGMRLGLIIAIQYDMDPVKVPVKPSFSLLFLLFIEALCFCVVTMAEPKVQVVETIKTSKFPRTIVISSERDPVTNLKIEMKLVKPDESILKQYAPSAFGTLLHNSWDVMKSSGRSFIPEASIFYGASFAVALRQVTFSEEEYPNALANMYAHQIADPAANFGFLSFLVTHRASNMVFQHLAEKYGLMRNDLEFQKFFSKLSSFQVNKKFDLSKDMTKWSAAEKRAFIQLQEQAGAIYPTPKFQNGMSHFKMQSGFVWAFLASTLITDLAHDPNFAYCSMAKYVWGPDRVIEETAKRGMTPTRACDLAWNTWVSREKIYDYVPDIAAALTTSLGLAFGAPPLVNISKEIVTRGAERYLPVLLRGFQIARTVGSMIPYGRALVWVGNGYVFLEATNLLTPAFKNPFESWRQGSSIDDLKEKLTNNVGKRSWINLIPVECKTLLTKRFSAQLLAQTPESTLKQWLLENGDDCNELPNTALEDLQSYSQKMSNWRQFWFSNARQGLANWQEYVTQFHVDMNESSKFYSQVISEMANGSPEAKFGGFIDSKRNFVEAVVAENRIRSAIAVIDSLPEREKKAFAKWKAEILSGDVGRMALALKRLSKANNLLTSPIDEFMVVGMEVLRKIYSQLDGLELITTGNYKLLELSQGTLVFNPEYANSHPSMIGRFIARDRAEYFLLSMLCGPAMGEPVVKRIFGFKVNFTPPRIISEQGSFFRSLSGLCNRGPKPSGKSTDRLAFNIDSESFVWNGQEYYDLWSLVANNLRPEFRGEKGKINFQQAWQNSVLSQVTGEDVQIVKQYKKLLDEVVRPAVERSDSKGYVRSLLEEIFLNSKLLVASQINWTTEGRAAYEQLRLKLAWIGELQTADENSFNAIVKQIRTQPTNITQDLVLSPYQAFLEEQTKKQQNKGVDTSIAIKVTQNEFILARLLAKSIYADMVAFVDASKQVESLELRSGLIQNIEGLAQTLSDSLSFKLALSEATGL